MTELTIFFDFTCPFCIVGWRRIQSQVPKERMPANIEWYPVILDANVPAEGVPFLAYHRAKYGERSLPLQRHVEAIGKSIGLDFNFAQLRTYPLSLNAHKLVQLAAQHGRATETAVAIMEAYFLKNREIQDTDVLVDIGVSVASLTKDAICDALAQPDDELLKASARARKAGITSVPSYGLGRNLISDTDALLAALESGLPILA